MALVFLDGLEGYASNTDMIMGGGPAKWAAISVSGGGSVAALNTSYRTAQVVTANSRCLYFYASSYTNATLQVPAASEYIVGFGFYSAAAGYHGLVGFHGLGSHTNGVVIGLNGSMQMVIANPHASGWGGIGTVQQTSTGTISTNVWHYIEVRVKCHATAGEVEIFLNGVSFWSVTNANTNVGTANTYQWLTFGGCYANTCNAYYDDFYVVDKSGTTNNTFLGPVSVYSLMPTANGSSTQMTPTGVASNWDAVNDGTNDTTTYVSTGTTGNKDYYTFEQLPGTVTSVSGVLLKARNTQAASGTRKVILNLKNGASVISSTLRALVFGSWVQEYFVADTQPDGSAWTPAAVNSSEGGTEAG
ncbi:MAG: hypothetical protein AAB250_08665 [Bdellovibrionota bacterium]